MSYSRMEDHGADAFAGIAELLVGLNLAQSTERQDEVIISGGIVCRIALKNSSCRPLMRFANALTAEEVKSTSCRAFASVRDSSKEVCTAPFLNM